MSSRDRQRRDRPGPNIEWHTAKMLTSDHSVRPQGERDNGRGPRPVPAMRLTFAVVRDGTRIIWSHTPGLIRDGDFVLTAHMRDDLVVLYLELLERSAALASLAAKRIEERHEERLTVSIAESVLGKLRA